MHWVRRPRRPPAGEPAPEAPGVASPRAADPVEQLPRPARMRRERRLLARQREVELRDVGGLAVEMARRDRFRPELIFERANDVLRLEQRMHELDGFLIAFASPSRGLCPVLPCLFGARHLRAPLACSIATRASATAA